MYPFNLDNWDIQPFKLLNGFFYDQVNAINFLLDTFLLLFFIRPHLFPTHLFIIDTLWCIFATFSKKEKDESISSTHLQYDHPVILKS